MDGLEGLGLRNALRTRESEFQLERDSPLLALTARLGFEAGAQVESPSGPLLGDAGGRTRREPPALGPLLFLPERCVDAALREQFVVRA